MIRALCLLLFVDIAATAIVAEFQALWAAIDAPISLSQLDTDNCCIMDLPPEWKVIKQ